MSALAASDHAQDGLHPPAGARRDGAFLRIASSGTSYGGHNALEAHFGLADAAEAESVQVVWPSGIVQAVTHVNADQVLRIVEDTTTPVVGAVLQATASATQIDVAWTVPGWAGRDIAVERALRAGEWTAFTTVLVAANGTAAITDTPSAGETRYGYRLRLETARGPQAAGEVWLELPAGRRFGIRRVAPNPASGPVTVEFDLDSAQDAMLEVFDPAGRRVGFERITGAKPGHALRTLGVTGDLSSGVYFVRLTRAGRSSTARAVIARR